jgi:hypothetical protein
MTSKMLPGHISVYAFAPEATADWTAPSAASLTSALSNNLGWDISCALEESGFKLGTTGYDTDNSKSICDIGNIENATFLNYEASLDGFRSDPTSITAVYNTFYELFAQPDRTFYLVERIGPAQGTAFAAGQEVSAFGVVTDYGVDVVGDNAMIMYGARFKPNGNIATFRTVAS